ncbi:DNA-binding LacI/PurR family transcriptional regulator [Catenuloplanes nepalensis]|uniref:DNA-binding LacI/PurR family transcriptional regulator n=1 Tax=Catenuloplanes nepalensis TaxID=587533 RepID=A0ABT9N7W7_9ACTN|nr:LacI family DNA-binding transcriptional regulator [Catenuloplanes nepalensis]MDP9799789.1 DNA-binding LacI/PurR family transcriptional regulator [Catenuloplanes nepalensis]
MTRIDDVARAAGVSTATVSRALRGLPMVSETTRRRVLEAATRLGYSASPSASRLAGGRTGGVAVVVPRITRWFFSTVVEAAEQSLHEAGYDVLLFNLGGSEQARLKLLHTGALRQRADAVMLISMPLLAEDFAAVSQLELPGVTVSSGTAVPGWPSVRIDDVGAARKAMEHLIGLGHTRIARICGESSDELAFTTHVDRRRGYLEALLHAGITPDPALEVEGSLDLAGGAAATGELLARGVAFTAIFATCDEAAMGALTALRRHGLRVPEDVSLAGIDDHDLAPAIGLTTVAQPAAEQGRRAVQTLLSPDAQGDVLLPTHLTVRESTAAPARTLDG